MFKSKSPELPFEEKQRPKPTGDLWRPSRNTPTTVPVPLPVVVVRVEGPFTALDRKLWLALVRHAWDDLDKPGHIHEVQIAELINLFRKVSGRRDLGDKGPLAAHEEADGANRRPRACGTASAGSPKRQSNGKTTTTWGSTACSARAWTEARACPAAVFHVRSSARAACARAARLGAPQRACRDEAAQQVRGHAL